MEVVMSKKGLRTFPYMKGEVGKIVGLSKTEHCVRVKWDTRKTVSTLATMFLRKKRSNE